MMAKAEPTTARARRMGDRAFESSVAEVRPSRRPGEADTNYSLTAQSRYWRHDPPPPAQHRRARARSSQRARDDGGRKCRVPGRRRRNRQLGRRQWCRQLSCSCSRCSRGGSDAEDGTVCGCKAQGDDTQVARAQAAEHAHDYARDGAETYDDCHAEARGDEAEAGAGTQHRSSPTAFANSNPPVRLRRQPLAGALRGSGHSKALLTGRSAKAGERPGSPRPTFAGI